MSGSGGIARDRGTARAVSGMAEGDDGGEEKCDGCLTWTGRLLDAAVLGLTSCSTDGARLMVVV